MNNMSSEQAKKYHSINFAKRLSADTTDTIYRNTWDNWHLLPSGRPIFAQPSPIYKFTEIPGSDGQLDLTDYLIGRPTYSMRQGSLEFLIQNGYANYETVKAALAEFFDGNKMTAFLDDDYDPVNNTYTYYYSGRFFFRAWNPSVTASSVTIEYQLQPYKYIETQEGMKEAGL